VGNEFIAHGFTTYERRRQSHDVTGYIRGEAIAWIDKPAKPSLLSRCSRQP
jgi:hypothetical protein